MKRNPCPNFFLPVISFLDIVDQFGQLCAEMNKYLIFDIRDFRKEF
jgi:hypothetical protein